MSLPIVGAPSRAIVVAIYALAAWRGDAPVKVAAISMGLATLATPYIQDHVRWSDPGHRMVFLDSGLFVILVGLLLARPRYWLVLAAAFQLLSAGADLVIMGAPVAAPRVWLDVSASFTWGVTFCILAGALLVPTARRRAAQGRPPDQRLG